LFPYGVNIANNEWLVGLSIYIKRAVTEKGLNK